MANKQRTRWTVTELNEVIELANAGFTNADIATRIGRTSSAVAVALSNERKRRRADALKVPAVAGKAPRLGTYRPHKKLSLWARIKRFFKRRKK